MTRSTSLWLVGFVSVNSLLSTPLEAIFVHVTVFFQRRPGEGESWNSVTPALSPADHSTFKWKKKKQANKQTIKALGNLYGGEWHLTNLYKSFVYLFSKEKSLVSVNWQANKQTNKKSTAVPSWRRGTQLICSSHLFTLSPKKNPWLVFADNSFSKCLHFIGRITLLTVCKSFSWWENIREPYVKSLFQITLKVVWSLEYQ